jgi:hypothetical protein
MVSISFLLDHRSTGNIRVPAGRIRDAQRAWKRRTTDIVMDAFRHALFTKNLEHAADLLALMESWQARHVARTGGSGRQDMAASLKAARKDLERVTSPAPAPHFGVVVRGDEADTTG